MQPYRLGAATSAGPSRPSRRARLLGSDVTRWVDESGTRKRPRTLLGARAIAPLTLPPSEKDAVLRANDMTADRGRLTFHGKPVGGAQKK